MLVTYMSNNSGGHWWLSDEDWANLEKAGWKVEWVKDSEFYSDFSKDGRWLGALAKEAEKEFPSIKDAITEFESITHQDVSDDGCGCCGAPHCFSWEHEYCSGSDCTHYLYDLPTMTLREAFEELRKLEGKK